MQEGALFNKTMSLQSHIIDASKLISPNKVNISITTNAMLHLKRKI